MARPRVYRHDARCPGCGSNRMRKDGFSGGRPAYRYGNYSRRHHHPHRYRRDRLRPVPRAGRPVPRISSLTQNPQPNPSQSPTRATPAPIRHPRPHPSFPRKRESKSPCL